MSGNWWADTPRDCWAWDPRCRLVGRSPGNGPGAPCPGASGTCSDMTHKTRFASRCSRGVRRMVRTTWPGADSNLVRDLPVTCPGSAGQRVLRLPGGARVIGLWGYRASGVGSGLPPGVGGWGLHKCDSQDAVRVPTQCMDCGQVPGGLAGGRTPTSSGKSGPKGPRTGAPGMFQPHFQKPETSDTRCPARCRPHRRLARHPPNGHGSRPRQAVMPWPPTREHAQTIRTTIGYSVS